MGNANRISDAKDDIKLAPFLRGKGRAVASPKVIQVCNDDYAIKRELDTAINSNQILQIISKHHKEIKAASIFGAAIQKCNVFRDWRTVQKIMKLLLDSNAQPSLTEFNVFMNAISRSGHRDALQIITRTFDLMIQQHGLTPDMITFGILFKTFKSRFGEAEKYWSLMQNKYGLRPNVMHYTQMMAVYAKCRKMEKATNQKPKRFNGQNVKI